MEVKEQILVMAAGGFAVIFALQVLEKLGINDSYISFAVILGILVLVTYGGAYVLGRRG